MRERVARSIVTLDRQLKGRQSLGTEWMAEGRCTKLAESGDWALVDAIFFPERNSANRSRDSLLRERQARRQCALCPVRRKCLAYALENERQPEQGRHATHAGELEPEGVYGGLLGRERGSVRHLPESERLPALERIFQRQVRSVLLDEELLGV